MKILMQLSHNCYTVNVALKKCYKFMFPTGKSVIYNSCRVRLFCCCYNAKTFLYVPAVREIIIGHFKDGVSYGEIAKRVRKAKSMVQSIIKRWKATGKLVASHSSGRPTTMTTRGKNRLARVVKTNIGVTTKRIFELYNAGAPRTMSRASLYRVLKKMGCVRRAIRKSVVVSRKNVILRKKWARSRRKWDPDDWKQYIFSDESSVVVGKDNRMYCWRKIDEKDSPHIICPPHNRKFTVMVWGAITNSGERILKWVQGNINSQK